MARQVAIQQHRILPSSYEPSMEVAGRVSCETCCNRSGFVCVTYKFTCHPLHLTHGCERHARRIR